MKSTITITSIRKPSKWFILMLTFVFSTGVALSQVAINTDNSAPNASAMLDVKATGLGLLAPRMTFANRPVSPATGLIIYQTDSNPGYYYYDGAAWQKVGRAADQYWGLNGSDIYNMNAGNVYLSPGVGSDGHKLNIQQYNTGKSAVHGTEEASGYIYSEGNLGVLNWPGNPMGLPKDVANIGVLGIKNANGVEGTGIYGWTMDNDANNYGGIFVADGNGTGINNAIYADADSASTNYAAYLKGRLYVMANNNLTDDAPDYSADLITALIDHDQFIDSRAIYGKSVPQPGYGFGIYGEGGYRGVYGYANSTTYTGSTIGVYGYSTGTAGTRYGVYGYAYNSGGTSAVGVYGSAGGATSNWAGYFSGSTYVSTDLRIATTVSATGYALSVNGKIACEEVLVQDNASWPDYVFNKDYNLMSLEELESSINENNHLPGLPPASEVEENGFNVADMQRRVLEKVEELTLYTIEQGKLIQELQNEVKILKEEKAALTK